MVGLVALCLLTGCVDQRVRADLTRADLSLLSAPGMTVMLCGTGIGLPDPHRAGACTAVVAGGAVYMVDAGPGSWETADLIGVPIAALRGVLLTKFLMDDLADLDEAITRSWIAGRDRRLTVYGPPGTAEVVNAIVGAQRFDVALRHAHHDPGFLDVQLAGADAHEFTFDDPDGVATVLDENGLKITAFSVGPVAGIPSVGYRFDYRGRSVVIAGHERNHPNLLRIAAGADVLLHEAVSPEMAERGLVVMQELGLLRAVSFTRDMVRSHATAVEVAETARRAGVGTLILSRLMPAPNTMLRRWVFMRGVRDVFPNTRLGEDGMRITLDPRS
jgi:ribonuclease Z